MQYLKKVKVFDLFGSNLQLLSEGQSTYQTFYGFFGTVIMIVCFIVVFYGNVVGFFRLQFLQYNTYQKIQVDQNFTLDSQNFKFAISISNYDLSDKQLFTVYVQQFSRFANGSSEYYDPIQLKRCNIQSWKNYGPNFQTFYKTNTMDNYFCSPQKFEIKLAGQFGSDVFNYAKIAVKQCQSNACSQAINSFLQKNKYVQYNIIYINKAINYSNTFQPFYNYPDRSFYRFVPYSNMFSVDQYFTPQYVDTDISVFPFQNILQNISYDFTDKATLTTVPYSIKDTQFFRHFFRISPQQMHVQRKVQSLDDFLSFLGGIFSIFQILGALILTPYAQFKFKMKVFNKSYFIKQKQNVQLQQLQKPNQQNISFFKFLFFKAFGGFQAVLNKNVLETKTFKVCQELAQDKLDILKLIECNNFLVKSVNYLMDEEESELIKRLKCQAVSLQDQQKQQQEYQKSVDRLERQFHKNKSKVKSKMLTNLIERLKGKSSVKLNHQTERNLDNIQQNG